MPLALEALKLKGARLQAVDVVYKEVEGGSCGAVFFNVTSGLEGPQSNAIVTSLQEMQNVPYDTGHYRDLPVTAWNVDMEFFAEGEGSPLMKAATDAVWCVSDLLPKTRSHHSILMVTTGRTVWRLGRLG